MGSYPDIFYKNSDSFPHQVLIVEDDIQLADVLKKALQTDWLDIHIVNHGDQVQELVKTKNFKLILLDIMLPGKDGFAILEELKANPHSKKIPVVMLTNLDGEDQMSLALKLGASDYFLKISIDFARLRVITQKYILESLDPPPSVKNALILHGTDFAKTQKQHLNNWYPWLKMELESLKYMVWLPELPGAWEPNLEYYWYYLKGFYYNSESILIGHSSGGTAILGILNELPQNTTLNTVITVAGFLNDKSGVCGKLFSKTWDWDKIKSHAKHFLIIGSNDDPYIEHEQTEMIAKKLDVEPIILDSKKHFSLKTNPDMSQFPELLDLIKENVTAV